MDVEISSLPSRFEVKLPSYLETFRKHFRDTPGSFWHPDKRVWSFPNSQRGNIESFLKSHSCRISSIEKSSLALFFMVQEFLYIKFNFEPQDEQNFRLTFPTASFDLCDQDWCVPKKEYPRIKEFFQARSLSYTYVNFQIQIFLDYIQRKLNRSISQQTNLSSPLLRNGRDFVERLPG